MKSRDSLFILLHALLWGDHLGSNGHRYHDHCSSTGYHPHRRARLDAGCLPACHPADHCGQGDPDVEV